MGRRKLTISADILVEVLKGYREGFRGYFKVTEDALPADAMIESVRQSPYHSDQIDIILSSKAFTAASDMEPIAPQLAAVTVDATCAGDEYRRIEYAEIPDAGRIAYEAERIKLKVGTFEADLDALGRGSVTVDGRPMNAVRMLVEVDANAESIPKIQLDLLCTPSRKAPNAAE